MKRFGVDVKHGIIPERSMEVATNAMQVEAGPAAAATIGIKRPLEQAPPSDMVTAPKQQKILKVVEATPEKQNASFTPVGPKMVIQETIPAVTQKNAPSPGAEALVTTIGPMPAPRETVVAADQANVQAGEPRGNNVASLQNEASDGMEVDNAKSLSPPPPANGDQEVPAGALATVEIPKKVLTPTEIAMEKVRKAEEAFKASHTDLEKKEMAIQAKIDQEEEMKEYDLWLKGLARDLLSMDPVTDAVSECMIDLLADVQEMYYDKENPWDPREHEELNYDKVDQMEIPSQNSNKLDHTKNSKDAADSPKIPIDNHPTYYTQHFQKIFNEFSYCNIQFLSLSFDSGPLG